LLSRIASVGGDGDRSPKPPPPGRGDDDDMSVLRRPDIESRTLPPRLGTVPVVEK
jgi:hypothetical protein